MGLVSRFLRSRDGAAFPARPALLGLALGTAGGPRPGGLRSPRPFHHAVSAGRGLSGDLVRPALRPLAGLLALLRRSLLRPVHLWLAGRAAGDVAVGRTGGVVAGVFRLARARFVDGLAVVARHRELGLALGSPRGCPASRRRRRADRRLSSPSLRVW